jgi:hypothetical protein
MEEEAFQIKQKEYTSIRKYLENYINVNLSQLAWIRGLK